MEEAGKQLALVGATLIDGTGKPPIDESVVVVRGQTIETVGARGKVILPEDCEQLDASGKYLLPGLIDLHVHIYHPGFVPIPAKGQQMAYAGVIAANNLRSALQAGITTVRGVCDFDHLDIAMRTAVERGFLIGPRLFVAGIGICMTGGHGSEMPSAMHEVDGVHEIRKAVRKEIKAGVDLIKLLTSHRTDYPEFSQEEINAGVEEAHRLGRKVAIHAASEVSVEMAATAGVDSIEHGSFVNRESAEIMAEKNIVLVPTLWAKNYVPKMLKNLEAHPPQSGEFKLDETDLRVSIKWFERCKEQLPKTIDLVRSYGIRIGAGTDCVFADQSWAVLPEELELLTQYGLTNMEAIEAATRVGAETLGMKDVFGTVEPGKSADIIMLDNDPLQDIAALNSVSWVMKEGKIIPLHSEWQRHAINAPLQFD
jgi:imidazolonepropionase-like amidohydrolase